MTIIKTYHFYAAHRNENLNDKCRNIHGHTYYVTCEFDLGEPNKKTGVTILFSDIDKIVDPIIKKFDHCFIINIEDPLLKYLKLYTTDTFDILNLFPMTGPTSCENLGQYLFNRISDHLPIISLSLQETTSSTIKIIKQ